MSLDFNLPLHWTIYSGDTDSVVPLTATRYSIDALSLPTITKWYPWYYDEEVSLGHHHCIKSGSPDLSKKNLAVPLPSQLHTLIMLICNGVDHAYLQVGGWCQLYEGLTLVTIRGAGHEVPLHRPRQGLKLFEHFLRDEPMPKPVESVQSY